MDISSLPTATTIDPVNDILPIVTASINTTQGISRNVLLGTTSQLVGVNDIQTLTNKSIAASSNTITGLTTGNLSSSAGIIGTQMSSTAGILGSQLSATAGIVGSQLSPTAGIVGSQLSSGIASGITMPSASGSGGNLGEAYYLANGLKMSFSNAYFGLTRIGNVVYLNGDVVTTTAMTTNTSVTGTTAETLPYGFRPATDIALLTPMYNGNLVGFWKWSFAASTGTAPEPATFVYYTTVSAAEIVPEHSWITNDPWSAVTGISGISKIAFN